MNIKFARTLSLVVLVLFASAMVFAKGGDKKPVLNKSLGEPVYTKFNINNISTWFKNDGESDINQNGNSGFTYPKGSNKQCVFQAGFLWGGKVDGQVRVGGSVYRQGTVPGRIKPDGTPANPKDADVRIYRVRPDYKTGDLSSELADGDGPTIAAIRTQYEKDWNEWPAAQGAPFEDKDGNKIYDPARDIPGVPGADQTIWFVANDFDPAQTDFMYGSLPMGIEQQATIWGYNTTGALGNMLFRKYIIINKSKDRKAFTDMYVSMWADADVGDAGDDFSGCDTTLSVAFTYNASANDATYGPTPPVSGFDFFQGPMVKGVATDRAIFKGKYRDGFKNLPMTSHYYFIRGDAVWVDPGQGTYSGTIEFYNFMQSKVGRTSAPFTDPTTGRTTKFAVYGDPQTRKGWIDGILHPPGDRRNGMASGPFNMAFGDTQEVVVAEIAAGAIPGVDRLGAIGLFKFYDLEAQLAYNNFFNVPTPPPPPKASYSAFDQEVIISWGTDPVAVTATENYNKSGFKFQGYSVYQLPSPSALMSEAKRVATFDVVDGVGKIEDLVFDVNTGVVSKRVVQFGNDTGLSRFISIKTDAFKGGLPLLNGSKYYFAVTAYAYNPDESAVPRALENPLLIVTVTPQKPNPGVRYPAKGGDIINFAKTAGKSDGKAYGVVIDPAKLSGAAYRVTFKDKPNAPGEILWTLTRGTTVLLADQSNVSGDDDYLVFDGLQIKVVGPPPGLKKDDLFSTDDKTKWGWDIPKGARRFTWAEADPTGDYHLEGFNHAAGWQSPRSYFGDGVMVVKASELKNVVLRLAKVPTGAVKFNPTFDPADVNVSFGYRYMRRSADPPRKPEFTPFIINRDNSDYAFQEFAKNVPLSAWDVDNPAAPRRLMVGFLENNVVNGLVDGKYWPADFNDLAALATSNVGPTGPREWLFIMDETYKETPDPKYTEGMIGPAAPRGQQRVMYLAAWNRRGPVGFSPANTGDDELALFPNRVITPTDVFSLTAPSVINDPNLAKQDVEEINVFPNPYYGTNPQELNKYQRFVTFSHLPAKATVRIFNLAGQLVRTLVKDSPDQFMRWDLQNEGQLPVASGLYIVHVDMPDLGTTKVLKVAIIQEQQILDRF